MRLFKMSAILFSVCILQSCAPQNQQGTPAKHAVAHPEEALNMLKEGNKRFLGDSMINTNYKDQIDSSRDEQHPFGLILTCMDSRIPPEILFDQGIGNIFVTRVAGNIEDSDILGSMEYAAIKKGVKLFVVMGHYYCGAVTGAVVGKPDPETPANLAQLLAKIRPAKVDDSTDKERMIDESARNNVKMTITNIAKHSKALNDLIVAKKLMIVAAYYDIRKGNVEFIE